MNNPQVHDPQPGGTRHGGTGEPEHSGRQVPAGHRYDDLFTSELLGLFRTTLTGRILDCNQALANLLGYASAEELMAVPAGRLYVDADERQRYLEELLEHKKLDDYEILLKHRSGRQVHVLEKVILHEAPGKASVIEGVVIDISALRRSEQEQRILADNYRQLAEQLRDGILMVQDGKVVYANPAAEAMAGGMALLGANLMDLVAADQREAFKQLLDGLVEGGSSATMPIGFGQTGRTPLLAHALGGVYMKKPAFRISLQDVEAERSLMQERLRATLAEEMNASLRKEIEEHQRTQEALEQSRRLSKSLIDSSLDMIVAVDSAGIISEFNPAATIKFGYEQEEVIGKPSRLLYADPMDYDRVQREMDRYGAYAGEVRNITKDGREFTSFVAASRLRDEEGRSLGSMGVSRDVTQAKKDRETLRLSEERYRDLVDNATDLIQSTDLDGRFTFVNKAWMNALGYSEEDLKSLRVVDLMADQGTAEKVRNWYRETDRQKVPQRWKAHYLAKDRRKILVEGISTVRVEHGKPVGVRSIIRDITAAHEAQVKLFKHAAKEKALFESSDHMFWTVDRRIALTSFNKGYHNMIVRLHGKAPQINLDPNKPRELFAPTEYHDFWKGKYEEAFAGNKVQFETRLTDTSGKRVFNQIHLSPVLDANGQVEEVFGIGLEVTAEREAELRAQEQSARLKAIFESSADVMIWSMDREFRITACNEHFRQVGEISFGRQINVGDNLRETFLGEVPSDLDRKLLKMYNGAFKGTPRHHENVMKLADGSEIWIEFFISPIYSDGAIHEISCLAHDVTQKKKNEQNLIANLREKEVLLKEVHHRVKNNLQIISSIFNLQRAHVEDEPRCRELVRESQGRIQSMAFIHESLYQSRNFAQVDLANYLERLCTNLMMSFSLGGRIQLHTQLEPLMLDLDRAIPCGLVLNELVSNALKHAFPDGREGRVDLTLHKENELVRITLSDDGAGFPAGYTEGRDCRLGMELVQVLMNQLGGTISRSTAPETTGTSYLITFEHT
mgnify:FL=1